MANTPNLGLHQWQSGDSFLREEFNEDFRKIDTAVGAGLKCITGSFTTNNTDNRAITLGFHPKVLMLFGPSYSSSQYPNQVSAFVVEGMCFVHHYNSNSMDAENPLVRLTETGFVMRNKDYLNYATGNTTYYVAFY